MSDQGALFGVAVPPDLRLGSNQRLVLELLAERPRSSEELGQTIHARRHGSPNHVCRFCKDEGASVAASLRTHGLVRFSRKIGVWWLVEQGKPKTLRRDSQRSANDDIPY